MKRLIPYLVFILFILLANTLYAQRTVWTKLQANSWYQSQPWLVGCNYIPSNAINQLEMWQTETFDPQMIDKELGWAEQLGFNTLRVYLHDKVWQQNPDGFKERMEQFLSICTKHNIRPMFVLFDSCWDPLPKLGKQREPRPGIHNSGWMQNPGAEILQDKSKYPMLEEYVKDVVEHFATDKRVLAWDVWNEPDNMNGARFKEEPANKVELVTALLPSVFEWARSVNPSQPLTSGIWKGDWSSHAKLQPIEKIQVENSDVISFHNYDSPQDFEKRVKWLQAYGKPLLCTEYMARGNNSTFQGTLPLAKKYNVAAYNWGFVAGKTNTIYPWDSWKKVYSSEPQVWFHDIFRPNGKPYSENEVRLIRQLTARKKQKEPAVAN